MRRIWSGFTRARLVVLCALIFFALCVATTALREPQPLQQGFILALMLCASGALLFAFARPGMALIVGGGLFLLLKFVSVLKLRYLDASLMPSDFVYAFLPGMVMQAAGLPEDPYFSAETALRKRCNGLYDDCAIPGLLPSYHAWIFDRLHVYE